MKKTSQTILGCALLFILCSQALVAQPSSSRTHHMLLDISHGQKFWNDPARMSGMDPNMIERVKYMTGEIKKSAASAGADVRYTNGKISSADLDKTDLLFVHIPSLKYAPEEVAAIKKYLQDGGSLFMVMDADYWSTLAQTNVNDMIEPFGITFGGQSPDTLSGGYTKAGPITANPLKITYHGARLVNGGTPFCFSNQSEKNPFGTFTELEDGGRMVVMGDGMVSLYMTSWNGVEDYQCDQFMREVFAWLLKKP